MHVDPENGINDLNDVLELIDKKAHRIIDEYDREITVSELLDTMMDREWNGKKVLRHDMDHQCIGQYNTIDYIVGEFS